MHQIRPQARPGLCWGVHDAHLEPSVGWRGTPLPSPYPLAAFSVSFSAPRPVVDVWSQKILIKLYCCLTHITFCLHSHYLSLLQPFAPDLKPNCSTNAFLQGLVFSFSLQKPMQNWTLAFFVLLSSLYLLCGGYKCFRLSWPHRQLFTARYKLSLSHRIVFCPVGPVSLLESAEINWKKLCTHGIYSISIVGHSNVLLPHKLPSSPCKVDRSPDL